jgi:hypothetical protein
MNSLRGSGLHLDNSADRMSLPYQNFAIRRLAFPVLAMVSFIVACASGAATASNRSDTPPDTEDPFAYCLRVGTIDAPMGGASPVPASLLQYLRAAIGLSSDAPLTPQSYYWRCMDQAVFVCAVGANIPCDTKADVAKRNLGADNYCRENPNAAWVPAYATGHNGIYEWSCLGGNSVRGKRVVALDARGYRIDFWHRISRR